MKRLLIPCLLMFACLKPVDESAFTAGRFATYYVAKTGNDANPGTKNKPWLTIRHAAAQVQAGDLVLVGAGTYDEDVNLNGAAGTAAAPIVFRSRDRWNAVVNGWVTLNSKHYSFENFEVIYDSGSVVQAVKFFVDSCALRGCLIHPSIPNRWNAFGVLIGSGADGVVIDGNTITGFGTNSQAHGIYGAGRWQTITHNTVMGSYGYNICAWPDMDSSEIAYNVCDSSVVRSGIMVSGHYNRVHHNVCAENGQNGLMVYAGSSPDETFGNDFYNNVCYNNNSTGIYVMPSLANTIRNNIVVVTNRKLAVFLNSPNALMDYNCYYPDYDSAFWYPARLGNFAMFRAATGQEAHGIAADPLLGDGWRLLPGSPCLFAGDPATPAGVDFYGNPTPAVGQVRVSMGAVEWVNPLVSSRKAKNIR